jgi:dihydroorotate dehydrogenase
LSGPPLRPLSLKIVKDLRSQLLASIPIIGCGGISSGADAIEFAKAGASCVQASYQWLYTLSVFEPTDDSELVVYFVWV